MATRANRRLLAWLALAASLTSCTSATRHTSGPQAGGTTTTSLSDGGSRSSTTGPRATTSNVRETLATTTSVPTTTATASSAAKIGDAVATTTAASTTTEPLSSTPLTAGLGRTPETLAVQLAAAWPVALDRARSDAERSAAGRLVQLVNRRLAARPEWIPVVLAAVPAAVRGFVDNDLAAALAPSRSPSPAGPPQTTLPAWTIREPRPAAELLGYYHEAEVATGVSWTVVAAINLVETRMGRIVGMSSAGAVGPMQFLLSTWAACCVGDPNDDHDAIVGAAKYLVRRGALTDVRRAIFGYNPNDAYVEMVSRYAANLAADPETYVAYHAWQVFYRTTAGAVRLPVGYSSSAPVDTAAYLAAHPEDAG